MLTDLIRYVVFQIGRSSGSIMGAIKMVAIVREKHLDAGVVRMVWDQSAVEFHKVCN